MQNTTTRKKREIVHWFQYLGFLAILALPCRLQAQFDYSCLFDAGGCDYTEVSGGSNPGPGIRLNNQSETIRLPYCSTEEEIIEAFEKWLTELIDPATECKRVRIEEIASNSGGPDGPVIDVSVLSGSTFLHELGFNVNPNGATPGWIRLPASCGGEVQYDVIVEGDCELGDGSSAPTSFISAGLTLQVFATIAPPVPDPVSVLVCDTDEHIDTTFDNWINGFLDGLDLSSHTTTLFCVALPYLCDEALQYGDCGPSWVYRIRRTNGFMQPQTTICPNSTDLECFQLSLKRALRQNDRNCGNRIVVRSTNQYGNLCGNKTATSYFEIVAPTITASGPADPNPLPACSTPTQIQNAFNQWLGGFSYSTDQGACDVTEEFYVNGSTDAITRDQVEPFLCGGIIDLEYVAARTGCRGNRSEVITGRFEVEEIQLMAFAGRACHDQALGHVLETNVQQLSEEHGFEVLAVNNGDLIGSSSNAKAGDRIFANGLADDSWLNFSDQEQTVTYTIRPSFDCAPTGNEQICSGQSVAISFEISPLPQQLANADFEVKMGEPLGMVLQPTGRGLEPTAYIVSFQGFDLCSEPFSTAAIYTPTTLQDLLSSRPTTGCTQVCQDQVASIKITPLVNGCKGSEQEINVKIIYNDDQPPTINCANVELLTDAGQCFASGWSIDGSSAKWFRT